MKLAQASSSPSTDSSDAKKQREQALVARALGEGATGDEKRVLNATGGLPVHKPSPLKPSKMHTLPERSVQYKTYSNSNGAFVTAASRSMALSKSPSPGITWDMRTRSVSPLSRFTPEVTRYCYYYGTVIQDCCWQEVRTEVTATMRKVRESPRIHPSKSPTSNPNNATRRAHIEPYAAPPPLPSPSPGSRRAPRERAPHRAIQPAMRCVASPLQRVRLNRNRPNRYIYSDGAIGSGFRGCWVWMVGG